MTDTTPPLRSPADVVREIEEAQKIRLFYPAAALLWPEARHAVEQIIRADRRALGEALIAEIEGARDEAIESMKRWPLLDSQRVYWSHAAQAITRTVDRLRAKLTQATEA